jgi:hypothetical protein
VMHIRNQAGNLVAVSVRETRDRFTILAHTFDRTHFGPAHSLPSSRRKAKFVVVPPVALRSCLDNKVLPYLTGAGT